MAKSIQDLCMWMQDLKTRLPGAGDVSIEIKGKGFFIWGILDADVEAGTQSLLQGEDLEETDINDLCYLDPADVAKIIMDNASVKDIKPEDL